MDYSSVASEASTVQKSNMTTISTSSNKKISYDELKNRLADREGLLAGLRTQLNHEKLAKRKLFSSLSKLATELKRHKKETKPMMEALEYANRSWYEGGMWRPPSILPGVVQNPNEVVPYSTTTRESLSHLFFNLVLVTAFTRCVTHQQSTTTWDVPLLYFAVFWMIWTKELNYSARFDSTDLFSESINVLTCVAVLCGSLSAANGDTSIMMMAAFIAALHILVQCRVAVWFRRAHVDTVEHRAKTHALFSILMTIGETLTWSIGVFLPHRRFIFIAGILFSIARLPNHQFDTDFQVASSRRGVLFTLLLGFLLQSVVVAASPFFAYQSPTVREYAFIGAQGAMLYCIKLFYSDDAPKLARDHALLVNRPSAFLFKVGHFTLLFSTTVLGSGLDSITHSYFAATAALPRDAKRMVCGGFAMVVLSIFLIKSMHMKRIPRRQKYYFMGAFCLQTIVNLTVVLVSGSMCVDPKSYFGRVVVPQDELTLVVGLLIVAFVLVLLSWLDEMIELALYNDDDDEDASQQAVLLVHPFELWWFTTTTEEDERVYIERCFSSSLPSSVTPLLGNCNNWSMSSITVEGEDAKKEYDTILKSGV